ncbi:MAG: hypothetical protein MZV49_09055 [Rhodopseudomonas palustris]|nr:hypothetical protein [Rhodopseudomonas palustris]
MVNPAGARPRVRRPRRCCARPITSMRDGSMRTASVTWAEACARSAALSGRRMASPRPRRAWPR